LEGETKTKALHFMQGIFCFSPVASNKLVLQEKNKNPCSARAFVLSG
jgi:hypothetical protein